VEDSKRSDSTKRHDGTPATEQCRVDSGGVCGVADASAENVRRFPLTHLHGLVSREHVSCPYCSTGTEVVTTDSMEVVDKDTRTKAGLGLVDRLLWFVRSAFAERHTCPEGHAFTVWVEPAQV